MLYWGTDLLSLAIGILIGIFLLVSVGLFIIFIVDDFKGKMDDDKSMGAVAMFFIACFAALIFLILILIPDITPGGFGLGLGRPVVIQ